MKGLKSEYIAQLYTCFQDKSNYYLLLELCEQGELFSALQREKKYGIMFIRFEGQKLQDLGQQLARGIEYIHSQNIVHRDLKLGNLLLNGNGRLVNLFYSQKIIDFGLALRLTQPVMMEDNNPMGTPNYIAPEVIKDSIYSKKADVWAFGVIMYTLATGNHPFEVAER